MTERTIYNLTLRAEPGSEIPPAIRLRRLLKHALRSCGLRCTEVREIKPDTPQPQERESRDEHSDV